MLRGVAVFARWKMTIGSADAWFAAETKPPGQGRGLVIEPLRGPLAIGQEPLCSEGCVLERVARFISGGAQRAVAAP